jgi:AcrR family transcriptional regulator
MVKKTSTEWPSGEKVEDSRVRRSRDAVLATTFELLTESGLSGLSVDEVSRRSGVAKTTIYRHWPTRSALVVDACTRIIAEQQTPDTGSLRGDVTAIMTEIGELLWTARWSSVLPSIVDAAERDPDFAEIHSGIQAAHAGPLRAVLEKAVVKGGLPKRSDVSAMVAALLGPLFYRRWFARQPIDARFVKTIIAYVIGN